MFKAQQHEETVAQGRALVRARACAASARRRLKLDAVAAKAGYDKLDEFFAACARDEINSRHVQTAIQSVAQPAVAADARTGAARSRHAQESRGGFRQRHPRVGVDRLMTGLARCCKPAPPDPIVASSRGQGHHHPPRDVREPRTDADARAGAPDRGEAGVGSATRSSRRHRGRGLRPAGPAARHLRGLSRENHVTAVNKLTRHTRPHGVHRRGREHRAADTRARARARRVGRVRRGAPLTRPRLPVRLMLEARPQDVERGAPGHRPADVGTCGERWFSVSAGRASAKPLAVPVSFIIPAPRRATARPDAPLPYTVPTLARASSSWSSNKGSGAAPACHGHAHAYRNSMPYVATPRAHGWNGRRRARTSSSSHRRRATSRRPRSTASPSPRMRNAISAPPSSEIDGRSSPSRARRLQDIRSTIRDRATPRPSRRSPRFPADRSAQRNCGRL